MTATKRVINFYMPRGADGELLTGHVSKRRAYPKSVDVRTFFDPLADRNASNAIPLPMRRKPVPPMTVASRGWRITPVLPDTSESAQPEPIIPTVEVAPADVRFRCPRCGRRNFRTSAGLGWHVAKALDCATRIAA
jgi:hypothetical protein